MIASLKKKLKEPVARYSNLKYIEWEPSDFTKHGYIATYALGKCRCNLCCDRWRQWDQPWKTPHQTKDFVS